MVSTSVQIVDFFVIGVQKGGTTALDMYLRQVPGIQMASQKEPHHFDDESIDWSTNASDNLHRFFHWQPGVSVVRGEATPIYSYWPNALQRLRRYNPSAKLIMCLRHPGFRAYSHWHMETQRGVETMPFATAVSPTGRLRVSADPTGVHRTFSYVERGFYSYQIERALALFPHSNSFPAIRRTLEPAGTDTASSAVVFGNRTERPLAHDRRRTSNYPIDACADNKRVCRSREPQRSVCRRHSTHTGIDGHHTVRLAG